MTGSFVASYPGRCSSRRCKTLCEPRAPMPPFARQTFSVDNPVTSTLERFDSLYCK